MDTFWVSRRGFVSLLWRHKHSVCLVDSFIVFPYSQTTYKLKWYKIQPEQHGLWRFKILTYDRMLIDSKSYTSFFWPVIQTLVILLNLKFQFLADSNLHIRKSKRHRHIMYKDIGFSIYCVDARQCCYHSI